MYEGLSWFVKAQEVLLVLRSLHWGLFMPHHLQWHLVSVSSTRLAWTKHRAAPAGTVWPTPTCHGYSYLCDLAEWLAKHGRGEVGEEPQHHLAHVRVILMLPQGLKGRNLCGSDNCCVGPGRSEITQVCVKMDIALKTATGKEMNNSAFGTGSVANMKWVKFGPVYSAWRKKPKILNTFH